MKLIVLASAFFGSVAMACPDLSGTYICGDENTNFESVVTQRVENGFTVYTETTPDGSVDYPADGKTYSFTEKGEGFSTTVETVGTCSADAFNLAYSAFYKNDKGEPIGSRKGNISTSLDENKNLLFVDTDSEGTTSTSVCKRK